SNPPSEVVLQWYDGSWEHRAYWGADNLNYANRYHAGALPPAGQWVRLEVPASTVGLEGRTLNGMAFTLYGGRATWDYTGVTRASSNLPTTSTVWSDDALPAGARPYAEGGDAWTWVSSNPTPFSGTRAHQSGLAAGRHEQYFYGATATLSVNAGDTLFTYVYLDPGNPPSEVMLHWEDGSWEHRAYWGANLIDNSDYGVNGTTSRFPAGGL